MIASAYEKTAIQHAMNVTLRQLQVLESVARCGTFTGAAGELHLTQPAVSMQIKQLEENLELELFEHIGKKIFLTEAGREAYEYSRRIAQLLQEAENVFEEIKGIQRGRLSISVVTTANHFATRLLAEFSRRFEGISFNLDVTNREAVLRHLTNNERDLVIMGQPPDNTDLISEAFLPNPLVVIAAPNHPLAGKKNVSLEKLAQHRFVMREEGSGTRSAIRRFFKHHGIDFTMSMEMTSNEAIKQAAEAGLGVGVVSIHTLEAELETGRLVILDVEGFPIERHWYLAHRTGKRLSPVAQAFRKLVLEEAKSFVRLPVEYALV